MRKPYFRNHVGDFANVIRTRESKNVFTTDEKYVYVNEIMDICLYLISLYYFSEEWSDLDESICIFFFRVDLNNLENRSICRPNFFKIKKTNKITAENIHLHKKYSFTFPRSPYERDLWKTFKNMYGEMSIKRHKLNQCKLKNQIIVLKAQAPLCK